MTNHFKKFIYLIVFAVSLTSSLAASADDAVSFFRAVRADNGSGVKSMIGDGFDPNTKDPNGQTALLLALREPSPKVIEVLLASPKVNIDARNAADETPLMMAALKGNVELASKLIARDADINKPGWTPLHYAATSGNIPIIKMLLDKDAFINSQSPNGTTPLMMAAMYGTSDAVKLLLEEGADPLMKNQLDMSATDFATKASRPDAIQMIGAAVTEAQQKAAAGDKQAKPPAPAPTEAPAAPQ
ncbi:MAG TPA: ankyrin repeat domain-containing protein [Variovorax sp.]